MFNNPLLKSPIALFISGPPAVGKTTVAQLLSKRLDCLHYDLDDEVEHWLEMDISSFVEAQGWDAFRSKELACLNSLCDALQSTSENMDPSTEASRGSPIQAIISLGGGTLLKEEAIWLVSQHGWLISFWAEEALLIERLQRRRMRGARDDRPLPLSGESLTTLLNERLPTYRRCDLWLERYQAESDSQLCDRIQGWLNSNPTLRIEDLSSWIQRHRGEVYRPDEIMNNIRAIAPINASSSPQLDCQSIQVHDYPVYFHPNGERALLELILQSIQRGNQASRKVVMISDDVVSHLHAAPLVGQLQARRINAHLLSFPAGENSKKLRVIEALTTSLLKMNIDRGDLLIAMGGGVTGDICGFLASIYMRGISWAHIPTSLLAQVDSSVGAKTGVNHPLGKNLLGAFYRPEWVWIDEAYLQTLPIREFRAGLVEAIKHGLIRDQSLFNDLISMSFDPAQALWTPLIVRAISVKAEIVEQDELERGPRALLNLGHTFGHAFEVHDQGLLHGEAIALGIALITEYSHHFHGLSYDEAKSILTGLRALPMNLDWRSYINASLWARVGLDKKRDQELVKLITLSRIGQAQVHPITFTQLQEQIEALALIPALLQE